MKVEQEAIPDVLALEPKVFGDALGIAWLLAGESVMTDKEHRGGPLAGAEKFD